jgi:hypothetical protein
MYSLTNGQYIPQLHTVDNMFIRQLYTLGLSNAKQGKLVTMITKDFISNRGEVADKKVKLNEKSVLNITKLSPLSQTAGVKNLQEDIALYRFMSLGIIKSDDALKYVKDTKNGEFLMIDYLLSASLCYVEVFEKGTNKVSKFFATRNRFIAAHTSGIDINETSRYINYLTPLEGDYRNKQLRILRLNRNKNGFKITQPRYALDLANKTVRVVPLFLISAFLEGISEVLKNKIVEFKYIKDNGVERELVSTLSSKILLDYYEPEVAEKILSNVSIKLDRGYIQIPELGGSKYDNTGVRALNLSRIISIGFLDEVERTFIDVDFNSILPHFKVAVEGINDLSVLNIIYQSLLNDVPKTDNLFMLKSEIFTYVDINYATGTTTFLKHLHKYMTAYKMIFKNYTGKPLYNFEPEEFDLGVE